jgi:nitrate reductase NapAB chaperone NapD
MDAPRRRFFRTFSPDAQSHVTSLLVQALPQHRAAVCSRLDARGCETHVAGTRIVVVAELDHETQLAELMGEISDLPGVLSVALVYHQVENTDAMNEELVDDNDPS